MDHVSGSQYSSVNSSGDSSGEPSELNNRPTHQNASKQSTRNLLLSSSGIIHSTSVGPLTPPSPNSAENIRPNEVPTTELPPGELNQPEKVCAIRELYNLIHNLKLQLDNVKFTEHSFVEMVNRSLSTAGINASFQISPQKTRASLLLKSIPATVTDEGSSEPKMLHPTGSDGARLSQPSKANATYGGVDTLLDDLNLSSLQPTQIVDRSLLSTSGLNITMAELRLCPPSPDADALYPSVPSTVASPRALGVRPSRLPKARGKPSNLIGSASICEEVNQQRVDRTCPLSVSFTAGDRGVDYHGCDIVPQHSAIGDLTMVEWQNRDLFERLSRATARLRDALEECADVSSELWTGDVSQRLLLMLSNHQLNETQSHDPVDNQYQPVAESEDRTPEPIDPKLNFDYSMGCLTQNRSVRFDGVEPLPPNYEPITPEDSLTQLYGSAWRSSASVKSVHSEKKDVVKAPCTEHAIDSKLDVPVLQRFVSLLTQALANVKTSDSADSTPKLVDRLDNAPSSDWFTSWVDSASHWFQSYIDVVHSESRTVACGPSSSVCVDNETDIFSMLECLERVYHDRVQHVPLQIGHTNSLAPKMKDSVQLEVLEHQTLSQSSTANQSSDKTPPPTRRMSKVAQCRSEIHETQPIESKQPEKSSLSDLSHDNGRESTAKHLEELSRLAEQLSNAQDTISCLERERRELLSLLPEAVDKSISDWVVAWNQMSEELKELKRLVEDSVPSKDYHQLEALVDTQRSDLSRQEKTIQHQRCQLNQFIQGFTTLNIHCDSDDFQECMNACFSALVSERNAMEELRQEKIDLNNQLEQAVPKQNFVQLQQQLDSLRSEHETVTAQLATSDNRLDQIEQLLLGELPEQLDQPLEALTEILIAELHELRDAVDQLTHEQQVAYALLRDISEVSDPGSLAGYAEVIKQGWQTLEADLTREIAEKNQAVDLLRNANLPLVSDPNALHGYVQACIDCLAKKQDEINRLGLMCEQNEEALHNSVPLSDYDDLKTELVRVTEELEKAQNELRSVETQLDDVVKTSVPFETYESKNERVAALEKELSDIQSKQMLSNSERDEIISILLNKTSRPVTPENWVEQIGYICDEFSTITSSMNQLHAEYELVLSECQDLRDQVNTLVAEMERNSTQMQQEHEAALATLREKLDSDFTGRLQALTEEQTRARKDLSEELEATRHQREQLSTKLTVNEAKLTEIGQKLHDAQQEIGHLRDSIVAHTEAAKAASETAEAQERRADELASHLECLRQEHRKCPAQLELVNAQTSPVGVCPTADEHNAVDPLPPIPTEYNQARIRKYGELKTVAFEIKEKLVRRTAKLEAALTEVARLRSVIQQDKEHASRVLEEVEDLRKQAVRKNRRIHELETELAQLKAERASMQPVSSAHRTRSSARTVSEVEQPRGAQYRPSVTPISHHDGTPMLMGSTAASLLRCPGTPFIDDTDVDTDVLPQPDSTSLLFANATPQTVTQPNTTSAPDPPVATASDGCCNRCEKLHSLVLRMKRLTSELQRRVDIDLREEYSLLATLDAFESQPNQLSFAQLATDGATSNARSLSTSNLAPTGSLSSSVQRSMNTSFGDFRTMVKSLHHARSRLKHYAHEMDRICEAVIKRHSLTNSATDGNSPNSEGELRMIADRSLDLLLRVHRRTKAFFKGLEVTDDLTARDIISDLHRVIRMLNLGRSRSSPSAHHSPNVGSTDDKENQPNRAEATETEDSKTKIKQRLNAQAERYYQRYRDLAQGLDIMTKELTETNNVLTAARANLERTTGISVQSNATGDRILQTWSLPTKPDSA